MESRRSVTCCGEQCLTITELHSPLPELVCWPPCLRRRTWLPPQTGLFHQRLPSCAVSIRVNLGRRRPRSAFGHLLEVREAALIHAGYQLDSGAVIFASRRIVSRILALK